MLMVDTLWANAYEAYDRLTPTFRTFLEGLTATHRGDQFLEVSKRTGQPLAKNRGAPENSEPVGDDLTAVHPVIRTNPVTGWKGVFVNRGYICSSGGGLMRGTGLRRGLMNCRRMNLMLFSSIFSSISRITTISKFVIGGLKTVRSPFLRKVLMGRCGYLG
jgi:hypothetical protein